MAASEGPNGSTRPAPVPTRAATRLPLAISVVAWTGGRRRRLAVSLFPMVCRNHEDDPLSVVNLVKEAPFAYPAAPSRRLPVLQAFDARTEIGIFSENRVNVFAKLRRQAFLGHRT